MSKRAAYQREWRRRDPSKSKNHNLKYRYGITVAERDALLEAQGNVCAICGSEHPKSKYGWMVDHCHKTNTIRGILCRECNLILGKVNDSIQTLYTIVEYLRNNFNLKKNDDNNL